MNQWGWIDLPIRGNNPKGNVMADQKRIAIIGGGTISHVRSHLAIASLAYGTTARRLEKLCQEIIPEMATDLYLTRMAGGNHPFFAHVPRLETNEDVRRLTEQLVSNTAVKIIFFNAAMVDWNLQVLDGQTNGKYQPRPDKASYHHRGLLKRADKVIESIRSERKDLFLIGFKQTEDLTEDEQYIKGLELCKTASCNLVFANDVVNHRNMVITPEEARYHVGERFKALRGLVTMAKLRSHLTFTRSTVVSGEPVAWDSDLVPSSLRTVVDFLIGQNAYKPFQGATVGHFAVKIDDNTFLTSQRRTNFNDLAEIGLVKVETDGPDTVVAYGSKPSVGGQSQRLVFKEHPGNDCIVHFHCPIMEGSDVPVRSQYEFECGSHECGKNMSDGLKDYGYLKAVYLDEHGPNIVFNRDADPNEIIGFIVKNFDLTKKTGGYVSIKQRLETPNTLDTAIKVLDP